MICLVFVVNVIIFVTCYLLEVNIGHSLLSETGSCWVYIAIFRRLLG